LWIEKSTMDDVLEPICRRYGMDLVTGVGFQSITSVISMLRHRVLKHNKPTRILYISDFDPAGEQMPVATSRQIEFWLNEYAPGADIKLTPLALTKEQVVRYRLPRVPIKDTDLRKQGFEDRHGEGAVELDALEALYPGELAASIEAAIAPYFDRDLSNRLREAETAAVELAERGWSEEVEEEAAELNELRDEADAVVERFEPRAMDLKADFDAAMEPIKSRLDVIRHCYTTKSQRIQGRPAGPSRGRGGRCR
jgi:hypothetical protein